MKKSQIWKPVLILSTVKWKFKEVAELVFCDFQGISI